MKPSFLLAASCCFSFACAAADFPDLPPAALVEKALHTHPAVRAAGSGIAVEEANRDRLEAGPHEFNLSLGAQRRREEPIDRRNSDREVGLSRAFRLPGKAGIDSALGQAGLDQARHAHGDAMHETARLLLRSWFDWQREGAAAREWAAQVDILKGQAGAAEKRVAAGDAAKIESLLASAQLTQAEAQWAQARTRTQLAADEFARHFPSIPLPEKIDIPAPQPVAEPFPHWREGILEHNHELRVARTASLRQRMLAQRADADRLPDPTVGLRWSSEKDGQEKIVGLQLSIPLPGSARAATARAATAETGVAAAREAEVIARVEAEARRTYAQAQATQAHWERLDSVAGRMEENARLLDRAWRLGEGQLSDLLAARRLAIENRLAAAQARLDANEARYRLLLDTHRLWPMESGEDEPHR